MQASEIQDLILQELSHGPLGAAVLANSIGQPLARVRPELEQLAGRRLVRKWHTNRLTIYHLTGAGLAHLAGVTIEGMQDAA